MFWFEFKLSSSTDPSESDISIVIYTTTLQSKFSYSFPVKYMNATKTSPSSSDRLGFLKNVHIIMLGINEAKDVSEPYQND